MKTNAPYPLSLRQLQYVRAVSETLSFRRAAERCHVSQPALSAQIAELESMLGVQAFERSRRGVLLTNEGRALLLRASRVLAEADELVACAEGLKDPFAGPLRVGVIPTVAPYLLPHVAPAIRKHFKNATLSWVEDKTEPLLHALERGEVDAAVVALESPMHNVEHTVLAKDRFVVAMAKGHPLMAKKALTAAGLGDADVLLLDDGHCLRDQALAFCARTRTQELAFRATSLSTLCHMVAGGAGITLLPELAASSEAAAAGLQLRAFSVGAPFRTLALVWRKGAARRTALSEVARVMRGAYPQTHAHSV